MQMRFTGTNELMQTTTHENGVAYKLTPEQELIKLSLNSFFGNSFYEEMTNQLQRIQDYSSKVSPDFLLKLSIRGRDAGLRTINQILLVEGLKSEKFGQALQKLVSRPDELLDIIGYYSLKNNQNLKNLKLANKLKKAIKKKLEYFNDYKLAKYKSRGEKINLFDLVNMTHAFSPSIDKLMKGKLESADTREKELSAKGNNKETRQRLMKENKLGALATIRNMRNMLQVSVEPKDIIDYLLLVDRTKIFPFQALQAMHICVEAGLIKENTKEFLDFIGKVKETFVNITKNYKGRVAIGIDFSGSMVYAISNKSTMRRNVLATYYGMLLSEGYDDADIYLWSTSCVKVQKTDTINQVFAKGKSIEGGTQVNSLLSEIQNNGTYDWIIVLTDEQISDSCKNIAKHGTVIWNLGTYKNSMASPYDKVFYFAGLNDKMFETGAHLFQIDKLVKEIEGIDL